MEPIIGEIKIWPGNYAPRGWAFCQGQKMNIHQFQQLYSIIGTLYGGDGKKDFKLPDLRGRVPVGAGLGPALTNRKLGHSPGQEEVTLEEVNLPPHQHSITNNLQITLGAYKGGESTVQTPGPDTVLGVSSDDNAVYQVFTYSDQAPDTTLGGISISGDISMDNTIVDGSNPPQSISVMQPCLVVNYIIAFEGIYPQRN